MNLKDVFEIGMRRDKIRQSFKKGCSNISGKVIGTIDFISHPFEESYDKKVKDATKGMSKVMDVLIPEEKYKEKNDY